MRTLRLALAPVVVLTTGACFATRNDLRIVHADLQAMRAERLAADSAAQRQLDQIAQELARVSGAVAAIAALSDSVHANGAAINRLRNDSREDLQAIRQQLIMIQELTGQSQRRIQELRAEMEQRAAELATPVPVPVPTPLPPAAGGAGANPAGAPTARDTTRPAAPAPQPAPGPAQLYQMGQDQLRRGSVSAARAAFLQLLERHPQSDLAPAALYGVAETWADEGNGRNADSVYALVVERYPRSEQAPNALYKRASAARAVGQTQQAMALYRQIVAQYPRSDAALLAQEYLRERP
jgi:tol-pal system protein YbgF